MIYSLTWLPEVLEQAGLKVAETDGWRARGRGPMGTVRGVICHHTATGAKGNMPSLGLLMKGREDLAGPLAQLGLGRDGTFYVIAAGRANHAGAGSWEGLTTGNASFIGIEAENDGVHEAWPAVQIDAYQRGVAALLRKIGAGANMCAGHKEYAPKRKIDPDFDMIEFRRGVAAFLQGKSPRAPIARRDDDGRPTLRRGESGPEVARAQALLNIVDADGSFGAGTEATVRAFQRDHGLVPDGIIGPASWRVLEPQAPDPTVSAVAAAAPPADITSAAAALPPLPPLPPADTRERPPWSDARQAYTPDGKVFAARYELGFVQRGRTTIAGWLGSLDAPPRVSKSTIRVLQAMSVNEGCFEAINSWDKAFLSCGILQWTVGRASDAGELAYVLSNLKRDDPTIFEECFGRFGLDVSAQGFNGHLSIDGKALLTADLKSVLRDVTWTYRFWRAAHAPAVRLAQFEAAAGRIGRFRGTAVVGYALGDWITSERGIAHLLDEHVNRPGHVPGTLARAIGQTYSGATPDPKTLDETAEAELIRTYLAIRALPAKDAMTNSKLRAEQIDASVIRGTLSSARNSFQP